VFPILSASFEDVVSMSSRRTAKVSEAIRETVSTTVLFELKDPRVKNVTVIAAEVSPDIRSAKVYVSVRGDEKMQALSLHGLNSARGFIQSKVAERLQTKHTPMIQFVLDRGIGASAEAYRIIREALGNTNAGNEEDREIEPSSAADSDARAIESADAPPDASGESEDPGLTPESPDAEANSPA
jgi:ribosome-binding factor A